MSVAEMRTGTATDERQDTGTDAGLTLPRKVVLHNCSCHTFQQVIVALVKSLNMSTDQAEQLAWMVHLTGAAVVYEGDVERCELIASQIEAWAGPGSTGLPLKVTVEE
jgi:ATP-dependent Clp protease adaptor protein ClpS